MKSEFATRTSQRYWGLKPFLLTILLAQSAVFAGDQKWKTDVLDQRKITVKSAISERSVGSQKFPLIEYVVSTSEKGDLATAILAIKDVTQHSSFLDLKKAVSVKRINENIQIVYYVFNAPWPFSPTDCVTQMTEEFNETKTAYTFQLIANPKLYPNQDYKRFEYYTMKYSFKNGENGKIEIQIEAQMSPPVKVPLWLIRQGFPNIAADIMRKLVKRIGEIKKSKEAQ